MMHYCPPVSSIAIQPQNAELWTWMEDFLWRVREQANKELEAYVTQCMIAVATGTTKKPVLKPSSVVADPVVFRTEQGQQNTEWLDKVSAEHQQPKSRAEGVLEMLRAFMRACGHAPRPDPTSTDPQPAPEATRASTAEAPEA